MSCAFRLHSNKKKRFRNLWFIIVNDNTIGDILEDEMVRREVLYLFSKTIVFEKNVILFQVLKVQAVLKGLDWLFVLRLEVVDGFRFENNESHLQKA